MKVRQLELTVYTCLDCSRIHFILIKMNNIYFLFSLCEVYCTLILHYKMYHPCTNENVVISMVFEFVIIRMLIFMHGVFLLLLNMNLIHNLKIFTALFYPFIRKNKAP